jgi:amino acid transporter
LGGVPFAGWPCCTKTETRKTSAPAAGWRTSPTRLDTKFISSLAGVNTPLAFLFGCIILLMTAVTLGQLAKYLPSAGGYFTYVSRTINPEAGFFVGWLYMLFDPLATGYVYCFAGIITEQVIQSYYKVTIEWWIFALAGIALTTTLSWIGIKVSGRALLIATLAEMLVLAALSTTGLIHPGPGGFNVSAFNPALISGHGLYLGIVFTIVVYSGWESSAPLAEESENPRRNIPRALIFSILIMGLFHTYNTWGLGLGWGTKDIASLVSSSTSPLFVLAQHFWGAAWILILIAFWNSAFAVSQAQTNTCTRMWYGMARAGALPKQLATIHPRHRTPSGAIIAQTIVTLAIGIALPFWSVFGPMNPLYFFSYALGIALFFIYSAGNLGAFLFYRREHRSEFNPILHLIFPVLSTVGLGWATYKGIVPLPTTSPLKYAPWFFLVWFVLGGVVLLAMRRSGRGDWLRRAGEVAFERPETPEELVERRVL